VQTGPQPLPAGNPAEPAELTAADEVMMNQIMGLLQQVFPMMMTALNRGDRGEAFADFLAQGLGFTVSDHAQIKSFGKNKLLMVIRNSPAWAQIAPIEAHFVRFLDEFLDWEPGWADEEEVPPPGPVTPIDTGRR
jgi:hypothetical protein